MTVSVIVTDDQMRVMLKYAETNSITIEDLMEELIERIEDEMDAKLADEGYERYLKDPTKAVSHEEVMKRFGLK
jgi:Mg2+/Co2+ transporter CorC